MKKLIFTGVAHIHTPNFIKRVLDASGTVQCIGVWDPDPELGRKYAGQAGTEFVPELDDLLAQKPEGAVICSETGLHKELIRKLAGNVPYLYAEKPLGFSEEDARVSCSLLEKHGTVFQTGYFMRGFAPLLFLKKEVERGAFGIITRVRHCNCHGGSLKGWFDTEWRWMADPDKAGCGAFGDLGTHSLDILMWFFGVPESCTAVIRPVTGRYGSCDESGMALLRFPGGIDAVLEAGWVSAANPVSFEIHGTKASAVVMNGQLYYTNAELGSSGASPWTDLPEQQPHAFQLFLEALSGKENVPLVTPREAWLRNQVMARLYEAARSGQWVKI